MGRIIDMETDPDDIYFTDEEQEEKVELKRIIIDPHYCSREEYVDLIDYLKDNSWDYKEIEREPKTPDRVFKVLGRHHRTKKQAVKKNYNSKEKFYKYRKDQMRRYSSIYGIAEAYEQIDGKWVKLMTEVSSNPHLK